MKAKLNKDEKATLAVVWCLLNSFTDIKCSDRAVALVMDAIEKLSPLTIDAWRGSFKIIYEGKTVYERDRGVHIVK